MAVSVTPDDKRNPSTPTHSDTSTSTRAPEEHVETAPRGPEDKKADEEYDAPDKVIDAGPKLDPTAPGASNTGDLGRRGAGSPPPPPDMRSEREKHERWPTVGVRPGSEDKISDPLPQGSPVRSREDIDRDIAERAKRADERDNRDNKPKP